MKRPEPKTVAKLLGKDLIKALALTGFLFGVHAYLEHRPSGTYFRQFQFALLEEGLKHGPFDDTEFEAGGERLPLVVDISKLHLDKSEPTNRNQLDMIIGELERAGAKAIGIDLEFAEFDSDALVGEDYQYLAKWREYGNVRVGLFRRAMKKREVWLGRQEFADLAAGIALPNEDPQHGFLYSRRWYLKTTNTPGDIENPADCKAVDDSTNCKEDLIQMPVAMWILSERKGREQRDAVEELQKRSTKYSPYAWLELDEYMIDYSYLKEIRKEIITPDKASAVQAFTSRIRNRVILVGDLDDGNDQFCYTSRQKPLAGALIHACSVATLNRGLLRELNETVSWKLRVAMTLFVLSGILSVRLMHIYSSLLSEWDYQYLEILAFVSMSIVIYLIFSWEMRRFGVYWPDFLWVSVALFIHPFLTEPFCRVCMALPKVLYEFVLTFAGGESGATR